MQGFQITVYEGAEYHEQLRRPINVENIVKSWAPTYKKAQEIKEKLHQKYDGIIEIQR